MKSKGMSEAAFLALLQKVLPKATRDPRLASSIYDQVAKEFHLVKSMERFETFCTEGSLPDLDPKTVSDLETQLSESFNGAKVTVTPDEKGESVALEIVLPDQTITNRLKVLPPGAEPESEIKPKFVPFPVSLPEDPELIWVLARREDFPPEEAARALATIEEEYWASKGGQKAQRDRVERTFAEFVQRVPAAMLTESGLKRHYKEPEPRIELKRLPPSASPAKAG